MKMSGDLMLTVYSRSKMNKSVSSTKINLNTINKTKEEDHKRRCDREEKPEKNKMKKNEEMVREESPWSRERIPRTIRIYNYFP